MTFNFLSIFPHGIWHTFQDISMFTWMHSSHRDIFQERERLNSQCFIQIFLLNILFDKLIINNFSINISSTEEHSWCEVIFIIDDIHIVEPNIFLFGFGLCMALKDNHFITIWCLNNLLFAFCVCANSTATDCFFINKVLFLIV